jgi:DNA-binding SARP family transcriptional activator
VAVPRAKIATLLWADRGEEQARASLRQTLSVLRRVLGDADGRIVVSSAGGLNLDRDALDVDLAAFEGAAESGTKDGLERAASLYQGPFLDGAEVQSEPFEEWLRGERARLAARAAEAITKLLNLGPGNGDRAAALALSAKLLRIDPLREDVHRAVMRLHLEDGSWNEAVRQFKECEAVLDAELGVAPGAETRSLHDDRIGEYRAWKKFNSRITRTALCDRLYHLCAKVGGNAGIHRGVCEPWW